MQIREVSPSQSAEFARWHTALEAGAVDGRVGASVSSLTEFTDSLAAPSPVKRRTAVAALAGEECVGAVLFELPLQSDLDTVLLELAVPPPYRRQGVGAALWDWAATRARELGRSIVQTEIFVPAGHTVDTWPGARFAAARGFVSANVEDHLLVDLPYDEGRLTALETGGDRSDGYRITSWAGRCPDEYVEAWAALHTAMSADVPTGELARDVVVHTVDGVRLNESRMAKNWTALNALALDAGGEPVGYSTLFLPRTQPEHAYQDDTLVLRAHRGHGLGARLKVANLRRLAGLPDTDVARRRWLHTYTAKGNAPMQAVNARFGFRAVEEMHEFERRG
ncbi:MAG TPA: GNAT family N-acetyltransferase [Nocardioidaceae bacterium]|nr:GNAT family N-acetyltransferase [Nocardioidaceae bacterium]